MEAVRLGQASVHVLPVVRGLPSEGARAAEAVRSVRPKVIGISVSPEELQALRTHGSEASDPSGAEEEVYMAGLSAWETPVKPAPCFTEALRAADRDGLRVEALDMDEETYTTRYTECVSTLEFIFQGKAQLRLWKKRFRSSTPEAFAVEWDTEVNGAPGFVRLQREREAHMASRLKTLSGAADRVLAIVEVERAPGVLVALRA